MFQISVGGETMHISLSAFFSPVAAFHTFFPALPPSPIPQSVSDIFFFRLSPFLLLRLLNPTQIVFDVFFSLSVSSHPSDLIPSA